MTDRDSQITEQDMQETFDRWEESDGMALDAYDRMSLREDDQETMRAMYEGDSLNA